MADAADSKSAEVAPREGSSPFFGTKDRSERRAVYAGMHDRARLRYAPLMKSGKPAAWIPHRPDPRGAAPARLGELLVGAQTFIAQKSGSAIPREEWRRLVGPRIANRTRVGRLHRGVLTLYVATSAWSNELNFLKQDLVAKLRSLGHEITDLRFLVDQIEPKEQGRGPVLRQAQPVAELPPDLVARLQAVDDLNLRAAIAQAARHSLGQGPLEKKKKP